jgi:hypothetical protein
MLGALSECVGNHQLLPSLLPLPSRTYFANSQHLDLVHAAISSDPVEGRAKLASQARRGRRRKIDPNTIGSVDD